MLKWLVAGKEGEEVDLTITEDPLATLNLKKLKKRTEIYSVNRWVFFLGHDKSLKIGSRSNWWFL